MVFEKLSSRNHSVRTNFVNKWNISSMSPNERYHRQEKNEYAGRGIHNFFLEAGIMTETNYLVYSAAIEDV